MPIVDIKGVGKAQFPDGMSAESIRDFLRKKYAQQAISGESDILARQPNTAQPYEPTLSERMGQGVSDALYNSGLVSDRYGAQQVGGTISSIGEMLPGIGDATAGDEFGRAVAEGDKVGMGIGLLGAIPIAGDATKKAIKYYHGGLLDDASRQSGGIVFAAQDINQAKQYAKGNNGSIKEFDFIGDDLIDEDDAIEVMRELSISPKNDEWGLDDSSFYELIDPQFDQFIGDDGVSALSDSLQARGKKAISFMDEDILPSGTGRQTAKNIAILPPATQVSAPITDDAIKQSTTKAKDLLKDKYPDLKIGISENSDSIILDKVIVPDQSKGTGTRFMNDLINDADSKGKAIGLTPSADFGGNKARLTKFYKRFGFVPNKGANKDYTISESMIRPVPQ